MEFLTGEQRLKKLYVGFSFEELSDCPQIYGKLCEGSVCIVLERRCKFHQILWKADHIFLWLSNILLKPWLSISGLLAWVHKNNLWRFFWKYESLKYTKKFLIQEDWGQPYVINTAICCRTHPNCRCNNQKIVQGLF